MGSVMYSEIDLLYVNSHRTPKLHNSFPFFIQCRGILAPRVMPKLFKSSRETRVKAPLHWLMFNPSKLFTTSSSQIFYPIVRSSSTKYYSNIYKNHVQSILRKIKKSSKVTQNWKENDTVSACFLRSITKNLFLQGRLGTRLCPHVVLRFPNISLFPKILSLKSFGISWNISFIKFPILDIKFRFTCCEWKLY